MCAEAKLKHRRMTTTTTETELSTSDKEINKNYAMDEVKRAMYLHLRKAIKPQRVD